MNTENEYARLVDEIQKFHNAANGLVAISLITPEVGLQLILASASGSERATSLLRSVVRFVQWIVSAPPDEPRLCLCCDHEIHDPEMLTFVLVEPDNPTENSPDYPAMLMPLCPECAAAADLNDQIARALKHHIWPNARTVQIHTGSGHA